MRGTLIAALLLTVFVTLFVLKNNYQVDVNYVFGEAKSVPFPLLLFLLLAIGSLITLLVSIPAWYKRRKEIKALQNEIKRLTKIVTTEDAEVIVQQELPAPEEDVDDFTNDVESEY